MANESQYYNPIIQAMVQSQQQQMERAKLQQQADQFKADKVIREHQLGQEQQRIEHEHEHQMNITEISRMAQELAATAQKFHQLKEANDASRAGVDVNKALPSMGLPAIEGIPDYQTHQQHEIEQIKAQTGAKTSAEMQAQEPFAIRAEERAFTQKKNLQDYENQFKERLQNKELASKEKLSKYETDTQRAISEGHNRIQLQIAGMQYNPTPEVAKAMFIAGATGQAKLNFANPQERAALGAVHDMGGREVDPKEAAALREGQNLTPIFEKFQSFLKDLPESKVGAFVQGHTLGVAKALGWSSDTQNKLNNLRSQALVIGRNIEGLTGGRVLSKQLELDLDSFVSGAITKDQAQERLDNLKDLYVNKQENMLMGGMPAWQKDLVKKTYGIKDTATAAGGPVELVRDKNGKLVEKGK